MHDWATMYKLFIDTNRQETSYKTHIKMIRQDFDYDKKLVIRWKINQLCINIIDAFSFIII